MRGRLLATQAPRPARRGAARGGKQRGRAAAARVDRAASAARWRRRDGAAVAARPRRAVRPAGAIRAGAIASNVPPASCSPERSLLATHQCHDHENNFPNVRKTCYTHANSSRSWLLPAQYQPSVETFAVGRPTRAEPGRGPVIPAYRCRIDASRAAFSLGAAATAHARRAEPDGAVGSDLCPAKTAAKCGNFLRFADVFYFGEP